MIPANRFTACGPAIPCERLAGGRIAARLHLAGGRPACWWSDARRGSTRRRGSPASARCGRRPSAGRCLAFPAPTLSPPTGGCCRCGNGCRTVPVRAVILALHGFNDYSNAFEGPGEVWAGHGIATYAYDQRGFGAAPERGLWPGTRRSRRRCRDGIVHAAPHLPRAPPLSSWREHGRGGSDRGHDRRERNPGARCRRHHPELHRRSGAAQRWICCPGWRCGSARA